MRVDAEHIAARARPKFRLWVLVGGLILAAILAVAFRLYAGVVLDGETAAFDETVRAWVNERSSPAATSLVKVISFTGKAAFLTALGTILTFVLVYYRQWRSIALLLVTMAGEIFLEIFLKRTYRRPRPAPFFELPTPESYSFPSGHALGALCFYAVAAYIIVRHVTTGGTRIAIAVFIAFWVLAVGFSRVYLGVHHPSDVLGGYFVGAIWLSAVYFAERSFGRSR